MISVCLSFVFDMLCLAFSIIFFWSTFVVLVGLVRPARRHPKAATKLRFAVLICARNEERVVRMPVKSVMMAKYPADRREVIVLADNCTDRTVDRAREAGATVWEKTSPSAGKGDVLAWGIDRVIAAGKYDAVAVFDADNIASDGWFDAMNDALQDGECVVTGRRCSSNARANLISGWYTVYWDVMNELSNRVRTNLGLSGKLTGTGFAFRLSVLGEDGWKTRTLVEDVEFTVQTNIRGGRVAYVPEADYADEQPETVLYMWRQLRRWATGGWQVVRRYFVPWLKALVRHPSLRLFDSFFAILTGMAVSFILLFNMLSFGVRVSHQAPSAHAVAVFFGVWAFVCVMGWFTAVASVALSPDKRRPMARAVLTFPVFSLILAASVLYTMVRPTRAWKPIPHGTLSAKGLAAVAALALLAGCFSVDVVESPVLGESCAGHAVICNYGWFLFGCLPLVCGNDNQHSWCPVTFFKDEVRPEYAHRKLVALAEERGCDIADLNLMGDNDVVFDAWYAPVPWVLVYKETNVSANLTRRAVK